MDPIKKASVELVAELIMSVGSDNQDWATRVERKMRSAHNEQLAEAEKRLQGIYKLLCPKATVDYALKDHE